MKSIQIKIGQQRQANKPIFLLSNGNIVCGNFRYKGRYVKKFKRYHEAIIDYSKTKPKNGLLDVSKVSFWDAMSIYDYMTTKWQRTLTVGKVLRFANETSIRRIIEDIKPEFKHALRKKWKSIFKRSDPNDPLTPKNPWEIL